MAEYVPSVEHIISYFVYTQIYLYMLAFLSTCNIEQVPDDLRESLRVGDAPEFEMLRMGNVFMQSDEVRRYDIQ